MSETEPAQPPLRKALVEEHQSRRLGPIVDVEGLNPYLVCCGCCECHSSTHPLAVTRLDDSATNIDELLAVTQTAKSVCENPIPISLGEAGEVFARFVTSRFDDDRRHSGRIQQGRSNYRSMMQRDRRARGRFGRDMTTVLATIRPSPRDDEGEWRIPMELLRDTANATQYLNRTLKRYAREDGYAFETSYVVAGTRFWGTPHGHVLLYLDDPEESVRVSDFANGISLACNRLSTADLAHHRIDDEGEEDALVVNHAPSLKDIPEDGLDLSSVYEGIQRATDSVYSGPDSTCAAGLYLGAQLAYIRVLGATKYDWETRPENAAYEFGATAWALRGHESNSRRLMGGTRHPEKR